MATTRRIATVFGGSGFIGRYVVKRLAAAGYTVRIPVRRPDRVLFLKPAGDVGQIVPLYGAITDDASVAAAVAGADVVVNLVGILAESRAGDFDRIQAEGAGRVARLAKAAGATHLVHLSAIGADPASPSGYGRSKAAGEAAVRAAFPSAVILRPSVVFGPEDEFFNRFAGMAAWFPVMPVIAGDTRLQPVYVGDVADAVMAALTRADAAGQTYELGGPRDFSFADLLGWILKETRRKRCLLPLPAAIARLQAMVLERLPGKLLTRDQLLMLQRNNVVSPGARGLADLGIAATPIDMVVPDYLRRYRPGGGARDGARAGGR